MSKSSQLLIRFSLCALFFWFGFQQLAHPSEWIGFLPNWTGYFPVTGELLIRLNGWFEVVLAGLMTLGFHTRLSAFFLGAHLLGIAISVGNAIGIRDATLAACTLALAFTPPDAWTADTRYFNKP